jgi:hypothetical protein
MLLDMRRPRLIDEATVQENHERFVRRAVEHDAVWTVYGERGPLVATTGATGAEPRDIYLFFSDEPYAKRALRESWPDVPRATSRRISLFELLYAWLPGIHADGHLAGTNWTGDLIGAEIEPLELQAQLVGRLPDVVRARHQRQLKLPRPL